MMIVLAAVLILGLSSEAVATSFVVDFWQDYYDGTCDELRTSATILNDCVLCHNSGGSSSDLNPYAEDLQTAHNQGGPWSLAIAAIDGNDSDGDTVINNVEIMTDCTFPGDPLSVPLEEQTWSGIKALYR
jgi:hypothetical protein